MKFRITTAAAAGLLAASMMVVPAEARGFGMHGGFGHVGGGWGHGGWGHGGWGWGGVGLGLAAGAVVGAALAAPYYYGDPYAYDYGYPVDYDYGYYGYAPAVSVGFVGPYWGYRRHYWAHRHYGYGLGYRGSGARVAYGGYRGGFAHATYRSNARMGFAGAHGGRFR